MGIKRVTSLQDRHWSNGIESKIVRYLNTSVHDLRVPKK